MVTQLEERARVEIHADLCKGCGLCIEMCPEEVLARGTQLNRRGYHAALYKGQGCSGCAICFYTCPEPSAVIVTRYR